MNKEILLTEAKEVRQKLTSYPGEIYKLRKEKQEAKFTELAKNDEDYNKVVKKLRDLEIRKNSIEIEIERLYNEFKATGEQTKILVAELNLIGEGEDEDN